MSMRNIVIYMLLALFLSGITGCERDERVETAALIVVDVIPKYIQKELFDKYILGKGDDRADNVISSYYTLNTETAMYSVADNFVNVDPTLKREDREEIEKKQIDIIRMLRMVGFTPVYKEPKEDVLLKVLPCFENVICLNEDNPKIEKTKNPAGNTIENEWYKIKMKDEFGYVKKGHLIFQTTKETDAVIIANIALKDTPYYPAWWRDTVSNKSWQLWSKVGERDLYRGEEVRWLGFAYTDTFKYYQVKRSNGDIGWVNSNNIVPDTNKGVLLTDVDIYIQPDDMDESRIKDKRYKMMELLIILEQLADKNWLKVVYDDLDKEYYINTGGHTIISHNSTDIAVASRLYDDYYNSKTIIEELRDTLQNVSGFSKKELKEIMDKITELENHKKEIDEVLENDRYSDTAFAFELKKLHDEIDMLIADVDYMRQIYKPSEIDEEEDIREQTEESDEVLDTVVD